MCGENKDKLTIHHAIPQTFKPKNNVTIPLCEQCHTKINSEDTQSMVQFIYKLLQNAEELNKRTNTLRNIVENNLLIKITKGKK